MNVYTVSMNVYTAYPSMLKIGRFFTKDKAKRFKIIFQLRQVSLPQQDKYKEKVRNFPLSGE